MGWKSSESWSSAAKIRGMRVKCELERPCSCMGSEHAAQRAVAAEEMVPERAQDMQADDVVERGADPLVDVLELLVQVVVLRQRRGQHQRRARDGEAAAAEPDGEQAEQ